MRTVLDAYALIAFVRDEPAAGDVERLLRDRDAAMTSVNFAEALDRIATADGPMLDAARREGLATLPLASPAA